MVLACLAPIAMHMFYVQRYIEKRNKENKLHMRLYCAIPNQTPEHRNTAMSHVQVPDSPVPTDDGE
ncbi:hypothetical protein E2C01_076383 [Portunus trituberculatus]|uniref:Uncharacterized protein n=1 Tax=Portunus trituberculatus TaxID=210409 RepID=A0A5B7IBB0_PORTR|nr:hypothetical protein [Portunus trituberculatus]